MSRQIDEKTRCLVVLSYTCPMVLPHGTLVLMPKLRPGTPLKDKLLTLRFYREEIAAIQKAAKTKGKMVADFTHDAVMAAARRAIK